MERDHWEGLDIGGGILKLVYEIYDGVVWTIDLAHERDQWRALVNRVMNLRVP
jgi:hypothetical protein